MPPLVQPMIPEPMRVARVRRETHDTITLSLAAANPPFSFAPGQFNMLYAFALGEVPISLSGNPARAREIVHTIRAVGATTHGLCRLRRGAYVGIRGPFGQPWPLANATGQDLVIIAGGLGLAPLRPAIYHLLGHRPDYGRVSILVGARTPDDLLFAPELLEWQQRGDVQVLPTVDRTSGGWTGRVGVVLALLDQVAIDPARTTALVCGPEVMMRFTVRALGQRGLAHDRIYLSLERNMKCAVGFCGHCQYGPSFVCKDGPVFRFDRIRWLFDLREI